MTPLESSWSKTPQNKFSFHSDVRFSKYEGICKNIDFRGAYTTLDLENAGLK